MSKSRHGIRHRCGEFTDIWGVFHRSRGFGSEDEKVIFHFILYGNRGIEQMNARKGC
jgi:hypothetical protein